MSYDPELHKRRSIRLPKYDYSLPGVYFVTICTQNRKCLFGDIADGIMRPNDAGRTAQRCWDDIPNHFPHVALDMVVIMPNHVHGILMITEPPPVGVDVGAGAVGDAGAGAGAGAAVGAKNFSPLQPPLQPPQPPRQHLPRPRGTSKTIGSIVRGFKIGVTKWMRENTAVHDVWQRNFWEHVVRDEPELSRIREYVQNNPVRWEMDRLYSSSGSCGESTNYPNQIREPCAEYVAEAWMA